MVPLVVLAVRAPQVLLVQRVIRDIQDLVETKETVDFQVPTAPLDLMVPKVSGVARETLVMMGIEVHKEDKVQRVCLAKMAPTVDQVLKEILGIWVTEDSRETEAPMVLMVTMVFLVLKVTREIKVLKELKV